MSSGTASSNAVLAEPTRCGACKHLHEHDLTFFGAGRIAPPERVAVGRRAIGTETRRRIGLLLTDLNGGGIQKMMLALGQGLVSRGHEVQLILYERGGPFGLEVPPGIQVHHLRPIPRLLGRLVPFRADPAASLRMLLPVLLPWKPIRGLEYLPALARHLRRSRLDALISAAPNCNLEAVWAKRMAGVDDARPGQRAVRSVGDAEQG